MTTLTMEPVAMPAAAADAPLPPPDPRPDAHPASRSTAATPPAASTNSEKAHSRGAGSSNGGTAATTSPPRAPAPRSAAGWQQYDPTLTNQSRQVLDYFGNASARATLSQMPRRSPIVSGNTFPPASQNKPFHGYEAPPTVSPYLNLHRSEVDAESAPNYHAFVRPQLDQLEASRRQQMEILRLQRQMQGAASPMSAKRAAAATASLPARYMDTAQFYSSRPR